MGRRNIMVIGAVCAALLGSVIAVAQPLGAQITGCSLRRTGFLGIGRGREADVSIVNVGNRARTFTIRIFALYPGNGRELAAVSAVAAAPGVQTDARVRFQARAGMTNVQCEVAQ